MRYNADCYQKRAAKLFFSRESRHHSVRDTYDYEYVTRTAQAHIAFLTTKCNNITTRCDDTMGEFNMDSKAVSGRLNLAHVARKNVKKKKTKTNERSAHIMFIGLYHNIATCM